MVAGNMYIGRSLNDDGFIILRRIEEQLRRLSHASARGVDLNELARDRLRSRVLRKTFLLMMIVSVSSPFVGLVMGFNSALANGELAYAMGGFLAGIVLGLILAGLWNGLAGLVAEIRYPPKIQPYEETAVSVKKVIEEVIEQNPDFLATLHSFPGTRFYDVGLKVSQLLG